MYIPKNKIKTNQYTRGGEYRTLNGNDESYVGYYWTMYNGKIFTGINQYVIPQEELIPYQKRGLSVSSGTDTDFRQKYAYNWNIETVSGQYQDMSNIETYNRIKEIDVGVTTSLPQEYYPSPTDEEYILGKFNRYFCMKSNENIFIELNKNEFDSLNNNDPNYDWKMYFTFVLNQVALLEERLGRKGIDKYLMGNYIQFYARNSEEILYSNGEDGLILPDGTAYIGYYHAMLDGTLMTGKYHGRGKDIVLTNIYD